MLFQKCIQSCNLKGQIKAKYIFNDFHNSCVGDLKSVNEISIRDREHVKIVLRIPISVKFSKKNAEVKEPGSS